MTKNTTQPARTGSAPTTITKATAADELAMHIAAVLAHPDTPVSIYNALGNAVHSLDAPPRYFDSPEYVALCLRLHLKGGAR